MDDLRRLDKRVIERGQYRRRAILHSLRNESGAPSFRDKQVAWSCFARIGAKAVDGGLFRSLHLYGEPLDECFQLHVSSFHC